MEKQYESMIIVTSELSDEDRESVFEKITKKIESLGGKILSAKIWAKERNFNFSLISRGAEKKEHKRGCFWLVNFSLETEKLNDLRETIRLEERILRNSILQREMPVSNTKV